MGRKRVIGVLGGMGPEATILLQQRLLAAVQAKDDADHIPLLIDMNPQVPSRIAHLIEGTGDSPAPVLIDMAQRLERAGVAALAMPCNTAHAYLDDIQSQVSVPFLNMIALTADAARRAAPPNACVGILASPATRPTRLFDKALEAVGLRPAWPNDDHGLLAAIRIIKAQGVTAQARAVLGRASRDLLEQGAGLQIIGCSEFSLMPDALAAGAQPLDAMDCLAEAVAAFSRSD